MGGHIGYESWLERDHVMLLDFDPLVVGISSQPFWLFWQSEAGKGVSHAPDYFARLEDGTAVVVDCRPADRRRPRDVAKFEATRAACTRVGWEFRLVGNPDAIFVRNVRWLAGYRHPRYRLEPVVCELLVAFLPGGGAWPDAHPPTSRSCPARPARDPRFLHQPSGHAPRPRHQRPLDPGHRTREVRWHAPRRRPRTPRRAHRPHRPCPRRRDARTPEPPARLGNVPAPATDRLSPLRRPAPRRQGDPAPAPSPLRLLAPPHVDRPARHRPPRRRSHPAPRNCRRPAQALAPSQPLRLGSHLRRRAQRPHALRTHLVRGRTSLQRRVRHLGHLGRPHRPPHPVQPGDAHPPQLQHLAVVRGDLPRGCRHGTADRLTTLAAIGRRH
ncbi:TnsA-like heteromeric transposase endonuclease subunit [Streptomyces sp. NPDC006294]|uniref:TnsA-like heteromeric transposase endonuclease subunit n=1 Tax=Streptomyces sp. NPDC006294 TaxID=3364743 RepID=UPI003692BD5E